MADFHKHPDAVLDYTADFTLAVPQGQQVNSVTWEIPAGLTKLQEGGSGSIRSVVISGGSDGTDYYITCLATTNSSPALVLVKRFRLLVRESAAD